MKNKEYMISTNRFKRTNLLVDCTNKIAYFALDHEESAQYCRHGLPAVIDLNGNIQWMTLDGFHRTDGSAITTIDCTMSFWIDGQVVTRFHASL